MPNPLDSRPATTPARPFGRWPLIVAVVVAFTVGLVCDRAPLRAWLATEAHAAATPASAASAASSARGANGKAQAVTTGRVAHREFRVLVNAIGTVSAQNAITVRTRVDGELKALHFTEGQPVRAGQLLAEIDDRAFRIALAQAEGALARDQSALDNARRDARRFRELLDKDAIARQQVEQQEALVAQLEGTVRVDSAQRDNAALQLSYTRIAAPISGLAGLRLVDPGNQVRASDAGGLLVIQQMQPVNVTFSLADTHLAALRERGREAIGVEIWDREQKTRLAEGRIASIDNAIDLTTGTVRLKAAVGNTGGRLYPNQFVNVRVVLQVVPDALVLPSTALMRNGQNAYVFLVAADGTARVRGVQTGESDGEWTRVRGSLQAGDRVVTDGTDRLRDGAAVEVVRERAEGGAQAAATPRPLAVAAASAPTPARAPIPAASRPVAPKGASAAAGGDARAAEIRRLKERAQAEAEAMVGPHPPEWMSRLPPEAAERLRALPLEQRRAWLLKRMMERAGL